MDDQKITSDFQQALQGITQLRKLASEGDAEAALDLERINRRLEELERKAEQRLREIQEKKKNE
jgi:hypothetical protein